MNTFYSLILLLQNENDYLKENKKDGQLKNGFFDFIVFVFNPWILFFNKPS